MGKKNMNFGDAINALREWKVVRRACWCKGVSIMKQVDADIADAIVPKMTSLSDDAKILIGKCGNGIHYRDQILEIEETDDGVLATYYIPRCEDLFAEDWEIVEP